MRHTSVAHVACVSAPAYRGVVRWLFLVALLPSCAFGSSPVVLDWRGAPERLGMAQAAAAEWSGVCGGDIVVTQGVGAPVNEVPAAFFADGAVADGITHTAHDRQHEVTSMTVRVFWDESDVIRHEMGHALGYVHVPRGIMATSAVARGGVGHVVAGDCEGPRAWAR